MSIKEFIALEQQLKAVKKEKEKLNSFDFDSLLGTYVKLNDNYVNFLKESYEDWADTENNNQEVDYELTKPTGKIVKIEHRDQKDILVNVKFPNGLNGIYCFSEIEICSKQLFLETCKLE